NGTCRFGVCDLLAEDARPTINERHLSGSAWINARTTVGLRVEEIERLCRQRVEVTHCGADRRSAACWIGNGLTDKMLVCAGGDRSTRRRGRRCSFQARRPERCLTCRQY